VEAIKIRNLSKRYGKKVALNDLSLTVPKGAIFGYLGPNGAGKTTTMNIITSLISPTKGSVLVLGQDIRSHGRKIKEKIGYIPEELVLYEKLSAREELDFVGKLFNIERSIRKKRIDDLLDLFDLLDVADKWLESYSRGMQQKVAIAQGLIHDPQVLLLDEPLTGLDPASARLVKDILKNLAKKDITIFLSTHQLHLVEELCTTMAIIHQGKLVAEGKPEEIKTQVHGGKSEGTLENAFIELTGGMKEKDLMKWRSHGK